MSDGKVVEEIRVRQEVRRKINRKEEPTQEEIDIDLLLGYISVLHRKVEKVLTIFGKGE